MTTVKIFKRGNMHAGFSVIDHTDFDVEGADVLCAAVSSSVQLTANGVTEIAGAKADISVDESNAEITLKTDDESEAVQAVLATFALHMEILSGDYQENIKFCILEV